MLHAHFLPMLEVMHTDNVANIRFNAAQLVEKLLPRISREVYDGSVKRILKTLLADPDRDVVYFATKAQAEALQLFP
jgi:serine/threonine-protein phosphatase 2A regulatory subunit A